MITVPLQNIDIWVQIFDILVGFMTELVGKHLGNYIGEFLEFDENNKTGPWRAYMRIRARLDVFKPLKKEWKVRREGGEWSVVHFKYERLGVFCYLCGLLGHAENFCPQRFVLSDNTAERGWGMFLKAETRHGGGGRGGGSRWLRESGDTNWDARWNIPQNQQQNQADSVTRQGTNQGDFLASFNGNLSHNNGAVIIPNSIQNQIPLSTDNLDVTHAELAMDHYNQAVRKRMRPGFDVHGHALLEGSRTEGKERGSSSGQDNSEKHFLMAGPGFQACQK